MKDIGEAATVGLRNIYRRRGVSKSEADALTHALHIEDVLHGAMCGTGRSLRRSTMKELERRGLVTEETAVLVDGDGWQINPERHRRCFKLTDKGRALARALKGDEASLFETLVRVNRPSNGEAR